MVNILAFRCPFLLPFRRRRKQRKERKQRKQRRAVDVLQAPVTRRTGA